MTLTSAPKFSRLAALTLLCIGLLPISLSAQRDRSLEAYMLAVSIKGDASIGRVSGVPVDVVFGTFLESLEIGGMIHYEGFQQDGPWGFMGDYSFMDLGFKGGNSRGGIIDAGLRQGIFEAMVAYRQEMADDATIDWFVGVRWWDFDVDLLLDPAITPGNRQISVTEDWVDTIVGGRARIPMSDSWTFVGRLDLGGLTGADFTFLGSVGFEYRLAPKWVLDVQYKALWVDYDNDGPTGQVGDFTYDTVSHGPLIGIVYEF